MRRLGLAALLAATLMAAPAMAAAVTTFDGTSGWQNIVADSPLLNITFDDVNFHPTGPGDLSFFGTASPYRIDPASAALAMTVGVTVDYIFGPFNLLSVDLADFHNTGAATSLLFTFTPSDGSPDFNQTVDLDNAAGLQTVTFNLPQLTQFSITGQTQLDNLTLSFKNPDGGGGGGGNGGGDGAPEPGTWGLMILGFSLAGGALRGRRTVRAA